MSDLGYTAACLAKAVRTLTSARKWLSIGDAEGACSRACCAMFNAAGFGEQTAAIEAHSGLLSFFGQKIAGTECLAVEYGRAVNRTGRSADFGA